MAKPALLAEAIVVIGIIVVLAQSPLVAANFAGPFTVTVAPPTAVNPVGTTHTVTVTVEEPDLNGNLVPVPGADVGYNVSRPIQGTLILSFKTTDVNGQSTLSYIGNTTGTDNILVNVCIPFPNCFFHTVVTKTWVTNPVGGQIVPVDMTSLFIAGVFTNAFWMVPTLGGIAGTALALFKIKRKR